LVAQIPSLILSLATAIIVTRVTTSESMTEQTTSQLANPTALYVTAAILLLLGIIPGMPSTVFISLAAVSGGIGFWVQRLRKDESLDQIAKEQTATTQSSVEEQDVQWEDVSQVDLISLEIGYGLIPLVNTETGGQLLSRVKGVRKKLSTELGFLIQPVRIRDNLDLEPNTYHLLVNGVLRGRGQSYSGKELAINPGHITTPIDGIATKEPAFGLDAVWIEPSQRDRARTLGYTVVDPPTAIATHLNSLLYGTASELLGHDEVQQILDKTAERSPKLVENLVPGKLSLAVITRTLQNLLRDGVPIRDMRTILEVLNEEGGKTQDPDDLTAMIRPKLGRMIVQSLVDISDDMPVMTLEPQLEQMLHNAIQQSQQSKTLTIDPELAEALFKSMRGEVQKIEDQGQPAILVVSPMIRPWLSNLVRPRIQDLTVLSYTEIPEDQSVNVVATISAQIEESR